MNTQQLEDAMARAESQMGAAKRVFCGVFPRDEIPTIDWSTSMPTSFIANTDAASEPGQHWVVFYFKSPLEFEFFDSFAAKSHLLYRFTNIPAGATCVHKLAYPIQSLVSNACGQHCLYFLFHRYRNSFDSISAHYSRKNLERNDRLVTSFAFRKFHTSRGSYRNTAIGGGASSTNPTQLSQMRKSFILERKFHDDSF